VIMDRELSFEEAIEELEEITNKMEKGEIPLEKSIELYEKAKKLIKFCEDKLSNVEKRIKELKKDENGNFYLKDIEEIDEESD